MHEIVSLGAVLLCKFVSSGHYQHKKFTHVSAGLVRSLSPAIALCCLF